MKLSRKGWNNILLFASLLMILLFSISNKVTHQQSQGTGILPTDSQILAITIDNVVWQQSNNSWQTNLDTQLSNQQIAQAQSSIRLWQQQILPVWPEPVGGSAKVTRIQLQLAGLATPIDLSLFHAGEQLLLSNWQGELLVLEQAQFAQLFTPLISIKPVK